MTAGSPNQRGYRSSAGLVSTTFGMYAFGALSCEERELGALEQVTSFDRQVARDCQTDDDCRRVSTDTRCTAACGTIASTTGAEELAEWLEVTSAEVCRDYEADGCGPLLIPPCEPPGPLACVGGQCQDAR